MVRRTGAVVVPGAEGTEAVAEAEAEVEVEAEVHAVARRGVLVETKTTAPL